MYEPTFLMFNKTKIKDSEPKMYKIDEKKTSRLRPIFTEIVTDEEIAVKELNRYIDPAGSGSAPQSPNANLESDVSVNRLIFLLVDIPFFTLFKKTINKIKKLIFTRECDAPIRRVQLDYGSLRTIINFPVSSAKHLKYCYYWLSISVDCSHFG